MTTATSPTSKRMQILANGDIIDCACLPNSARNTLYKTELCKHFADTGTCRYGTKCQFAHGEYELRGVLRHPKYKTTKCKAFMATGRCMYGSRCRFIHDNSSPEDNSDDEDSMTRAEQDQENMKAVPRNARVNPRRLFEPESESTIDLSLPSLKLKPVSMPSFEPVNDISLGIAFSDEVVSPSSGDNQEEDVGGAFSRLSIFQKICRATD